MSGIASEISIVEAAKERPVSPSWTLHWCMVKQLNEVFHFEIHFLISQKTVGCTHHAWMRTEPRAGDNLAEALQRAQEEIADFVVREGLSDEVTMTIQQREQLAAQIRAEAKGRIFELGISR